MIQFVKDKNPEGSPLQIRSVRDLYYVFFRHKMATLLTVLVVVGAFGTLALLRPDEYRSEAKLMLRSGRDLRVDMPNSDAALARQVNSELEVIKSASLVAGAADASGLFGGLGTDPVEREERLAKVLANLTVEAKDETNIVRLAFQTVEPADAQGFLEALIELYRAKHLEVHSASGAYDFFAEQAEHLRELVNERERELRERRQESGIGSVDDDRRALAARVEGHASALRNTRAEIAASRARVETLTGLLQEVPEIKVVQQARGMSASAFDTLVKRLYELRLERLDAASKYKADSRTIRDLDAQIAGAEAMLEEEDGPRSQIVEGLNENYRQIELQLLGERSLLASLEAREGALDTQLEAADLEQKRFTIEEVEVRRLSRELEIAEGNYRRYADSFEQARVDRALEEDRIANMSVVQAATFPVEPVGPHRLLFALLGLVVAAFAATGVAFGFEALDDSVRTPEDVEQTVGVRPIASIPYSRNAFSARRLGARDAARSSVAWWPVPESMPFDAETFGEGFWNLTGDTPEAPRVLGVIGDRTGAGTTTVAANLAEHLASQPGVRVLLVDANLQRPTISKMLGAGRAPGLSDGIHAGGFESIETIETPVPNLRLLAAGTAGRELEGTVDPEALLKQIEAVAAGFDFVVLDLPPVADVDAVGRMREQCQGLMLVLEANRSRRQVARYLVRSLSEGPGGEVAVVLNKREFPIPSWLYSRL